jgi:hypothetical protein
MRSAHAPAKARELEGGAESASLATNSAVMRCAGSSSLARCRARNAASAVLYLRRACWSLFCVRFKTFDLSKGRCLGLPCWALFHTGKSASTVPFKLLRHRATSGNAAASGPSAANICWTRWRKRSPKRLATIAQCPREYKSQGGQLTTFLSLKARGGLH